jgi:ketosteroid isomerase-like protein
MPLDATIPPELLVRRVTNAFENGDFQPLLEHLDDDVVWKSASRQTGAFRFGGEYRGREGVLEVTSQIAMSVTFLRFRPLEIVSDGEIVWCLMDTKVVSRGNGRSIEYETALRVRIKNGRISELHSFFDTAWLKANLETTS